MSGPYKTYEVRKQYCEEYYWWDKEIKARTEKEAIKKASKLFDKEKGNRCECLIYESCDLIEEEVIQNDC